MLSILAPSKTMDFVTKTSSFIPIQHPIFHTQAEVIARQIKNLNHQELKDLMHISAEIAVRVHDMYQKWHVAGDKAALWAYKGDVYKGMKADLLDEASALWAEEHLVIVSGLYGIARPFDRIAAYRLEMKAQLKVGDTKDLYAFWSDRLARYVAEHAKGVVCILASDEYARPVTKHLPKDIRVVTPMFFDKRPGGNIGVAPIYSKMMRGVIARWIIDHRVDTPEGLQDFSIHGYTYDPSRSTPNVPVFYREVMKPLVFS